MKYKYLHLRVPMNRWSLTEGFAPSPDWDQGFLLGTAWRGCWDAAGHELGALGAASPGVWDLSWIHQLQWEVMGWKTAADARCQTLGLDTAGRAARRSGKTWQWGHPVPGLAKLPDSSGSVVSIFHLHSPRMRSWTGIRRCQLLLQL